MYNPWLKELTESYVNTKLNINENDSAADEDHPDHPEVIKHIKHFANHHGVPFHSVLTGARLHLNNKNNVPISTRPSNEDLANAISYGVKETGAFSRDATSGSDSGYYKANPHETPNREEALASDATTDILNHLNGGKKKEVKEHTELYEELSNAKEYANILENILNALLDQEIISEEMISEVLGPGLHSDVVYSAALQRGQNSANANFLARKAADTRAKRLQGVRSRLLGASEPRAKTSDSNVNMASMGLDDVRAERMVKSSAHGSFQDQVKAGLHSPGVVKSALNAMTDKIGAERISPSAIRNLSDAGADNRSAQLNKIKTARDRLTKAKAAAFDKSQRK